MRKSLARVISICLLVSIMSGFAIAEEISNIERYNLTKKDATGPMISSLIIGFGSGQMMSGETNKGLLFAAGEGLILAGILYYQPQKIGWQIFWTALISGIRVWEVVDVYQGIEKQNKDLRKTLGLEK